LRSVKVSFRATGPVGEQLAKEHLRQAKVSFRATDPVREQLAEEHLRQAKVSFRAAVARNLLLTLAPRTGWFQ